MITNYLLYVILNHENNKTKLMRTKSLVKKISRAWLVIMTLLCLAVPAAASGLSSITQGFLTSDNTPLGSIVSLQKNSSNYVSAATTSNVSNVLGVVVGEDNSLLSLSDGQSNQIQVATSGVVQVLVSNINGSVNAGDQITASPISGVGMIATSNVKVVGTAQDSLGNSGSSRQTYKDKSGHKHTVNVGEIPLLVSLSYYYKQPDKTLIPSVIQNLANALAGKTVNSLPIIISLLIFIVTLIIVVSIIYSMIHGSIISVGRNPLSQAAIYRNLIQLSGLVVVILAVAVVSIYMVLARLT